MAETKPQARIPKAKLYKMVSYKGTVGGQSGEKMTPLMAAASMSEVNKGVKAIVAGINSLGATLNSLALTTERFAESMQQSVSQQIKNANKIAQKQTQIEKKEDKRQKSEILRKKKEEQRKKREKAEEDAESGKPGLFKKIRETFKENTKKAFGGLLSTLGRLAGFFLKYFVAFGILDWMAKNPEKVEKLAKGLFALGKFIFKVTEFLVGSALDGLIRFLENPISLKGFFGAIQFVLSAAPIFVGLAFLKNPVATVKALTWVLATVGKGIMNMFKAGKLADKLRSFSSGKFGKIALSAGAGATAAIGVSMAGGGAAEALGAGVGAGAAIGGMAGGGLGKFMAPIFEPIGRFFKMIGDVFNSVMAPIKDALSGFFEALGAFMNGVLDMVEPHLPLITSLLSTGLKIAFWPLFAGIEALTAVLKFFTGKKGKTQSKKKEGKAAGGKVVIPRRAGGGSTAGVPGPLMSKEEKFWDDLLEAFGGKDGIISLLKEVAGWVVGLATNPVGTAVKAAGSMLGAAWNWAKGKLGFAAGGQVPTVVLPKAAGGGWIQGPQSGYPVSLDGGRSVSFIGHGTEWVGYKGFANGGAFVVPFDTPATKSNPGLTTRRMREASSGGYGMPTFSIGGALKNTIPKYSKGGKVKFDPTAYGKDAKNTEGLVLNDKTYYVKYVANGNEVVIKQMNKRISGNVFGQELGPVAPGSDEFKAVLSSNGFKDSVSKETGFVPTRIKNDPQIKIFYTYDKSYKENYKYWIKKGYDHDTASSMAASAAKELALEGTNSKGEKLSALPGAKDPQTGEAITGAADASMKDVDVVNESSNSSDEEGQTLDSMLKALEKDLSEFGKRMAETSKSMNDSGGKITEGSLKESEAKAKKMAEFTGLSSQQLTQAFDMPPIIQGAGGGGDGSAATIVTPGKSKLEADPYLMPKFGLVADFNNDMVDLM